MGLIVAHGYFDGALDRPVSMVLAGPPEEALLGAEALEQAAIGCRLLGLIACGSGSGRLRLGDADASSLGLAGLLGGASCTLSTTALVDESATLELLREFVAGVAGGESIAVALESARASIRATKKWSDPFFWANVQATGLAHRSLDVPAQAGGSRPRTGLLLGVGIVGIGAAVVALRTVRRGRRGRAPEGCGASS